MPLVCNPAAFSAWTHVFTVEIWVHLFSPSAEVEENRDEARHENSESDEQTSQTDKGELPTQETSCLGLAFGLRG